MLASVSCTQQFENDGEISNSNGKEAVFKLYSAGFENTTTRSG